MISSNDILARLQNGEDAQAIANEMVDALNTANEIFQKEEEAKRAAAEAVKGKELQKISDLQTILDLLKEFFTEYYCEDADDEKTINEVFADLDAKSVITMIEEIGEYAVKMNEMQKHLVSIFGAPTPKKSAPATNADAIIGDFLSSMGLK